MKKILLLFCSMFLTQAKAQNIISIPDTLTGTSFSLNIYDTSRVFYNGYITETYGINRNYLGPTLMLNQGDSISLNVNNFLMDTTTIHWHGLHVSAKNDGGPHTTIAPNTVWNPKFKVRDHASMYWYHPHLHMMTNLHASMGAAGLIIVRDTNERKLNLPRRYSVDDFPLVLQTKCFNASKQILIDNPYDSVPLVNGTVKGTLSVPAQVIRLRLLNASSERVLNLGLQGNMAFSQIGSDGGLLNTPVSMTRLKLSPGERAEILLNLSANLGQSIDLISFAAELPNANYGAAQAGMGPGQVIPGYSLNPLNGSNFKMMTFSVTAATPSPVITIPSTLTLNSPWLPAQASVTRTLLFTAMNMGPGAINGPFLINNSSFDMETVNYYVPFNNTEVWVLTNQTPIAHPFHIHDVQFYVLDIGGAAPAPSLAGRKDVIQVPAGQTVRFIARFENFCDSTGYYMYHCHMLPHEDDGMMGQFAVVCPTSTGLNDKNIISDNLEIYPNPAEEKIYLKQNRIQNRQRFTIKDISGKELIQVSAFQNGITEIDIRQLQPGIYLLEISGDGKTLRKKFTVK